MKINEFISQFATEEQCRAKFKEYRDKVGVVCPKCGCTTHYWVGGKSQHYECKCCGYKQSLRANTVMHHSHLSFKVWLTAMWLITTFKTALSTAEIQRQIGSTNYRSVWCMVQKIRAIMGRDEQHTKLSGEVEIDTAFFKVEDPDIPHSAPKKKYSHEHLVPVLVMAESLPTTKEESKMYSIKKKFGRVKMLVMPSNSKDSIYFTAIEAIEKHANLVSDGSLSHHKLRTYFADLYQEVCHTDEDVQRVAPWVHICIGHSKNEIRCSYHGITEDYIQNYLNEFCWKKNRRYSKNLFAELIEVSCSYKNCWHPEGYYKEFKTPDVLKGLSW